MLFGIATLLYGINIFLSNNNSVSGVVLSDLEKQAEVLRTENNVLKEEILKAQSLTSIYPKAKEIGFIEAGETMYIR